SCPRTRRCTGIRLFANADGVSPEAWRVFAEEEQLTMESRREQISVGIFVLIAAALLIFIVFALSGVFAGSDTIYYAKFNNAAGLEPGASVHYAGGPKSGHIVKIRIDPDDPALIDLTFTVTKGLPVKTDSK